MKIKEAKAGMRVFCTATKQAGYIVYIHPDDKVGCNVQFDHGGYSWVKFGYLNKE